MPGTYRGQEKASDPLELKSWMAVNHNVGGEDWTLVPLQEQQMLLIRESSLSSPSVLV